jgi:tetratricopeptide (TPR) repeat protein
VSSDRPESKIEATCEGIIEAGWLLALGLVPLLFNIYSSRTYEPDKAAVLRSLVLVMVAAWLWKLACGGRASRPLRTAGETAAGSTDASVGERLRALFRVPLIPLVVAMAVALVLGSVLSVDSRLSWLGSYARAQGSWTQLSYLVVFALVLTHLRTHAQWRRVVFTVIVTSVPIALYAVFQELGLDPVTTVVRSRRAYSTLGNSIFLGGYLVMAVFLTALELGRMVVEWAGRRERGSASRWWPGRGAVVVGAVLICQLAALVLSQSRGPFLGLLAGAYVFILVGLLRLRRSAGDTPWLTRWASVIRWAVPGTVGAALVALLLLVVVNIPGSPLERVRELPYVGRLGSVLDTESRTIQVRLYIWRSISRLLQSSDALQSPDGTPDRLDRLRPVLGTGPETLGLAVNRFVEPRLGQLESLAKIPDRSHNETFDLIVMHGAVGTMIWLGVFGTLCALALRRLGLIQSRGQAVGFWAVLAAGATLGVVTPYLVSGEATLSGVGLSVGLISALALFVTVQSLLSGGAGEPGAAEPMTGLDGIVLALLATFVAHMVETQVGIAITATRLYFWFYAAVLVLAAKGWLEADEVSAAAAGSGGGGKARKRTKARRGRSPGDSRRDAIVPALIAGTLCLPLVYGMTLSSREARRLGEILANSWLGGDKIPTIAQLSAMSWLVLATLVVAWVTASNRGSEVAGGNRPVPWTAVGSAVGLIAVFAAFQSGRIARAMVRAGAPDEILSDAMRVANHFAALVTVIVLLCLVIGALIGLSRGRGRAATPGRAWLASVSGLIIAVISVIVIARYDVDPIRADSLLRVANQLTGKGRVEAAIEILDRAAALDPREPMFHLVRGAAALSAASAARDEAAKGEHFDRSETSLRRALELAPLDPDHSANLARCLARQAGSAVDRRRKVELLQDAAEHYLAAVRLRPWAVLFLNESGRVLLNLGRYEEARAHLERAVEVEPSFVDARIALAALDERSAAAARARGDAAEAIRLLEEAAQIYERTLELEPELEAARAGRDRVRRAIASARSAG